MAKEPSILAFIPARYNSSRFPGKPLAIIRGESMISRIHRACLQVPNMKTYVVTDDDRIESHVSDFGGKVIRVDKAVANGTERVFHAWHNHFQGEHISSVLNIQGDIPLLKPEWLRQLGAFHADNPNFHACTMVAPRPLPIDPSPHRVKVAYCRRSHRCLYFSRNPIPFNPAGEWFYHLGIYSILPDALQSYASNRVSHHEQCEGLEQLRFLEWGLEFGAIEVESEIATVDTPEDIPHVERIIDYEH